MELKRTSHAVYDTKYHLVWAPKYRKWILRGNIRERVKSISASVIFEEHPEVKKELWGGEFWEDGYFARTVGDKVTAEVIRKYIRYHHEEEKFPKQLKLF